MAFVHFVSESLVCHSSSSICSLIVIMGFCEDLGRMYDDP